jgi:hypothetical protein
MKPTSNLFVSHIARSKTESAMRVRSLAGMTVALLFLAFMLLPYSAKAQCAAGWNVGGKWFMNQGGTPVSMDLVQTGGLVKGTAHYSNGPVDNRYTEIYGDVEGTVKNDDFNVHIYWQAYGLSSVYSGKISPQGRIDGEGYGTEKPSKKFAWFSSVQMTCPPPTRVIKSTGRPKADPTPTPVTRTVKTTGRRIVTAEAPNSADEPSPNAPMITASRHSLLIRAPQTEGKTTLTWNGGPLHRAAELWLKVDDEDENMVIASTKGSLEATIVAGKMYLYMLKEAGKTLATVTVQFRQGGQVRPNDTSPPKEPDDAPTAVADEAATTETNAPQISATPNNAAFVPGKIAHTVIRWDGGPDHPSAELWVKVDDQDEKLVIEQGKGSRQMVVEPGKSYLYILRDSGTRLATVTVKFH